jgi:hypothetical protein
VVRIMRAARAARRTGTARVGAAVAAGVVGVARTTRVGAAITAGIVGAVGGKAQERAVRTAGTAGKREQRGRGG